MTRIAEPQLGFADLELRHQGVHLDPLLQAIASFLEDQASLVEPVRPDLVRGLKNPATGRSGIPPESLTMLCLAGFNSEDTERERPPGPDRTAHRQHGRDDRDQQLDLEREPDEQHERDHALLEPQRPGIEAATRRMMDHYLNAPRPRTNRCQPTNAQLAHTAQRISGWRIMRRTMPPRVA